MPIGTPPGATGSGDQKNTTQPIDKAKAEWAGILPETLLSSAKHSVNELLGKIPLSIAKHHTFDWLHAAQADILNALDELERVYMVPTPHDRIIKSLGVVAEVLQVELPSAEALRIYAKLLSDEIPTCCWNETCQLVLKQHQYNNLPKPADFLRAAEPLCRRTQAAVNLLKHTNKKIEQALSIKGELRG